MTTGSLLGLSSILTLTDEFSPLVHKLVTVKVTVLGLTGVH